MERPDRGTAARVKSQLPCFLRSLSKDSLPPLNFNSRGLFTSARTSIVSLRTTLVGMSGEGWFEAFALRSLRSQSMSSAVRLRSIAVSLSCSHVETHGFPQRPCQTIESAINQIVSALPGLRRHGDCVAAKRRPAKEGDARLLILRCLGLSRFGDMRGSLERTRVFI